MTFCTEICWRRTSPDAVGKTINVACGESFNLLELVTGINKVLGTNVEPTF